MDAQESFDPWAVNGLDFRTIPSDTPYQRLRLNHNYFDHRDALKDLNCIFPAERLRELETERHQSDQAVLDASWIEDGEGGHRLAADPRSNAGLRQAVPRGELSLVYQPQYELGSGRLVGVEALLRWDSPDLGPVPPARFIPLAEATGQIHDIGRWVLNEACRQAAQWQESADEGLTVAVNLSGRLLVEVRSTGEDTRVGRIIVGVPGEMHDVIGFEGAPDRVEVLGP